MATVTLLELSVPREMFDASPAVYAVEWDKAQGYRVRAPNGGISIYPTGKAAISAAWRMARGFYKRNRKEG